MASTSRLLSLLLLTTSISYLNGQSESVADNAYDSFDALDCKQFKAIIAEAHLEEMFRSIQPLTVFAFNDTAYRLLPPYKQADLYDKSSVNNFGAREYVNSFTMPEAVETTSFSNGAPYRTYSLKNRVLFLDRKQLRLGNVASGLPGPTRYFCNGAMVIQPNIQAGQHVIHIIDQVLDMPYIDNALGYASGLNPDQMIYQFYEKFMYFLQKAPQEDGEYNYNFMVHNELTASQVTFFLPSDDALRKVPQQKLSELQGNTRLMLQIVALHIIPNEVIYTSMVNHNEQFNSGRIVFRKSSAEAVYVTGAIQGGRPMTALINPANITVLNGVVHQIDSILGFVFKTVWEEISTDPITNNFEQLINRARADLKNALTASSGVVVFAPTSEAMYAISNVYQNYQNNQSLLDMVLQMSLLQQGPSDSLLDQNRGYESYNTFVSRYNGRLIKVYSEGNDTWVEGGYVKARVVKPDIGCTNGVVHQIDAVFGIPTRDIPQTIFCEDRLESTYIQLQYTGIDQYMRDPTLTLNAPCKHKQSDTSGSGVPNTGNFEGLCGEGRHRCEFTFFVPNGTAIDNFARTSHGRTIMNDPVRWRWLLRRLMTFREKIYLDQIAYGAPKLFYADNGEELVLQVDSRSSIPSGQRTSYLMFEGLRAEIIHSDIGATNGVIHIISSMLYTGDDLRRPVYDFGAACSNIPCTYTLIVLCILAILFEFKYLS